VLQKHIEGIKGEIMDHIVYLDFKSEELVNLIEQRKDIILRGATGRKLPYKRVAVNDMLYLCNNNGEMLIRALCTVKGVTFSEKLDQQTSEKIVDSISDRVKLSKKALMRFRGKRYLTIIEIKDVQAIEPFSFNKEKFSNMDDWLLVENINRVRE